MHLNPYSCEKRACKLNPAGRTERTMDGMAGSAQRFYNDDEAEQILRVAASMSTNDGRLSYEKLIDTAAELGISPDAVEKAERQVMAQRQEQQLQAEFERAQKHVFFGHLVSFLSVNAGLIVLNLLTSPHHLWFFWAFFGWGVGLFGHARGVFVRSSDSYREEFEKWKAARASRLDRKNGVAPEMDSSPRVTIGIHVKPRNRD